MISGTTNAADLILHGERLVNFNSENLTDFLKGILLPLMSGESVYQCETRWRTNSHYFCFVSVQHELTAVHPRQSVTNACLNAPLNRTKFIRCCTLWELRITSIRVKVARSEITPDRSCECSTCEQNRSQNGALWYSIHKEDRSRHKAIKSSQVKSSHEILYSFKL